MEALFTKYRRTQIAEMRPVTQEEIDETLDFNISVSNVDFKNGSPKIGDMIARNPKNHNDQWLVAEQYFKDNFASMGNDLTTQLQADKVELLEALKYANRMLKNSKDAMYDENYIESLIQKHKQ